MRIMVLVKADTATETGEMPDEKFLTEMGNYNDELVKAGVMLAGEGLHPTSKGKRVHLSRGKAAITDGPFAESKELIAGFWMWKVNSMQEAVDWIKRCPTPPQGDMHLELRPVFEAEDFGAEFTPELRAQEDRQRAEIARRHPQ